MNTKIFDGQWGEQLKAGIDSALISRSILNNYFGRVKIIEEKLNAGLVTEADHGSEKAIREW